MITDVNISIIEHGFSKIKRMITDIDISLIEQGLFIVIISREILRNCFTIILLI